MTKRVQSHRARRFFRFGSTLLVAAAMLTIGAESTQTAVANGDTRTLQLYHIHSKESLTITFKRNGRYDQSALNRLNHFLRDWRNQKQTKMEPRLFDVLWEVYRETGSRKPVHIVSSYRSPETNSMLRSRSKGVARNSQHTLGRAIDFHLPDVPMSKAREAGLRLQRGGVGFYPSSGLPFVHLDVGNVRHWPRMTRQQLVRLFPDGKTVHLPSDGKPLPGYALAKAEIEHNRARGGSGTMMASNSRGGFLSNIFGGGGDEDEDSTPASSAPPAAARGRGAPTQPAAPASPASAPEPAPVALAAVPLPVSRPAALASGTQVAEAPRPSGPEMVWNRGAQAIPQNERTQIASLASETTPTAANLPVMPAPRPAANASTTPAEMPVVAFAPVEASVPLPMLRPGSPVFASAGGLPGRSRPLEAPREAPRQEQQMAALQTPAAPAAKPGDAGIGERVSNAYLAQGRAAAKPAEQALSGGNLGREALRTAMAAQRSVRDPNSALAHPRMAGGGMLEKPARVVQSSFGTNPTNGLRSDAFAGSSIAIVRSQSFTGTRAAGPLEVDIPKRRG